MSRSTLSLIGPFTILLGVILMCLSGCTEEGDVHHHYGDNHYYGDDDDDGPIDPADDDDDDSVSDDDDDDETLFVEMFFTTAYHAADHFDVVDPTAEVTLGTFQFENHNLVPVTIDAAYPTMMIMKPYEVGGEFNQGNDDSLYANDLVNNCVLRSWPEMTVYMGPSSIDGSGQIDFIDDFTLAPESALALDVVCELQDELPAWDHDVAFAVDLTDSASVQAEDEDGNTVNVEITAINGNPPQVAAVIEATEPVAVIEIHVEDYSFETHTRGVEGARVTDLYPWTTVEGIKITGITYEIRGDMDGDLDNGVQNLDDPEDRFDTCVFEYNYQDASDLESVANDSTVTFTDLDVVLTANTTQVISLTCDASMDMMGSTPFGAVIVDVTDIVLEYADGDAVDPVDIALMNRDDDRIESELNNDLTFHVTIVDHGEVEIALDQGQSPDDGDYLTLDSLNRFAVFNLRSLYEPMDVGDISFQFEGDLEILTGSCAYTYMVNGNTQQGYCGIGQMGDVWLSNLTGFELSENWEDVSIWAEVTDWASSGSSVRAVLDATDLETNFTGMVSGQTLTEDTLQIQVEGPELFIP